MRIHLASAKTTQPLFDRIRDFNQLTHRAMNCQSGRTESIFFSFSVCKSMSIYLAKRKFLGLRLESASYIYRTELRNQTL